LAAIAGGSLVAAYCGGVMIPWRLCDLLIEPDLCLLSRYGCVCQQPLEIFFWQHTDLYLAADLGAS